MSLGTILLINFMIALRAGFPPGTFSGRQLFNTRRKAPSWAARAE